MVYLYGDIELYSYNGVNLNGISMIIVYLYVC